VGNGWFAGGHFTTGVMMAASTGAAIAEWIAGGTTPEPVRNYVAHRAVTTGGGAGNALKEWVFGFRPRARRWSTPPLFRSARLNAAGRAAVALVCAAFAALGYLLGGYWVAGGVGPRLAGSLGGALLGLALLVAVDRRRWGRTGTSMSWGGDPGAVQRAAEVLHRHGVPVEIVMWHGIASLSYRNRYARRVRRALSTHEPPR
jgi:hypothetical protein